MGSFVAARAPSVCSGSQRERLEFLASRAKTAELVEDLLETSDRDRNAGAGKPVIRAAGSGTQARPRLSAALRPDRSGNENPSILGCAGRSCRATRQAVRAAR